MQLTRFRQFEVPWTGLAGLVPEDHARYWQITLDFLKIAMTYWPAHLADQGAMNPKARRSALIARGRSTLLVHGESASILHRLAYSSK